ncbi:reverse transcriptase domain-containing protein [Trichonephila clavipes]|nr:reverse transcriptase domain-containing protein [Trichonephila clavipes]
MFELKRALSLAHNTSPGPNGISYELLRHLNENSLSGFHKGRSTLDNIITLENKFRNAFVWRNHLVSIFFDIEKAYDRTWRYGILRTLFNFGLRGNLLTFKIFLNLRTFRLRLGGTLSAPFTQAEPRPPYGIENLLGCVSHITGAESLCYLSSASSRSSTEEAVSCVLF